MRWLIKWPRNGKLWKFQNYFCGPISVKKKKLNSSMPGPIELGSKFEWKKAFHLRDIVQLGTPFIYLSWLKCRVKHQGEGILKIWGLGWGHSGVQSCIWESTPTSGQVSLCTAWNECYEVRLEVGAFPQ